MEKRLMFALVVVGVASLIMFFIQETKVNELKNKISEQEKDLEYKEEVILSQGQLLIENEYNNCYCGFYEDFYYEHSVETGAFE